MANQSIIERKILRNQTLKLKLSENVILLNDSKKYLQETSYLEIKFCISLKKNQNRLFIYLEIGKLEMDFKKLEISPFTANFKIKPIKDSSLDKIIVYRSNSALIMDNDNTVKSIECPENIIWADLLENYTSKKNQVKIEIEIIFDKKPEIFEHLQVSPVKQSDTNNSPDPGPIKKGAKKVKIDDLISSMNKLTIKIDASDITIGHLNIQGIQGKFPVLKKFLQDKYWCIFALSETLIKPETEIYNNYELTSHRFYPDNRLGSGGGGTAFFVRTDFYVEEIELKYKFPDHITRICLKIQSKDDSLSRPLIIFSLYLHPKSSVKMTVKDIQNFIDSLDVVFGQFLNYDKCLVGDFNIDLFKTNEKYTILLKEKCKQYGMENIIKEPTRVTRSSKKLIDPVFVNFRDKILDSGVFSLAGSDHEAQYLRMKNCKP